MIKRRDLKGAKLESWNLKDLLSSAKEEAIPSPPLLTPSPRPELVVLLHASLFTHLDTATRKNSFLCFHLTGIDLISIWWRIKCVILVLVLSMNVRIGWGSSDCFSHLIVMLLHFSDKKNFFSELERCYMVEKSIPDTVVQVGSLQPGRRSLNVYIYYYIGFHVSTHAQPIFLL